jgi:hypothetical protein
MGRLDLACHRAGLSLRHQLVVLTAVIYFLRRFPAREWGIIMGGRGISCGIVRLTGLEMADRKRSRLSRGELTPFSERGNAVLFEDIAGIKVAV